MKSLCVTSSTRPPVLMDEPAFEHQQPVQGLAIHTNVVGAGVFAPPAATTGCTRSSLLPARPSRAGSSSASFAACRRTVFGRTTLATSPRPELPLLNGSNGTTPNDPTRRSAIASRVSSARYNLNLWLDSRGALQALRHGRPQQFSVPIFALLYD